MIISTMIVMGMLMNEYDRLFDYYQDIDNDGYSTASSICACQPEDYTTTTSGDCFDDGTNASITYLEHLIQRLPLHVETIDFNCDGYARKSEEEDQYECSFFKTCPLVGMVRFLPVQTGDLVYTCSSGGTWDAIHVTTITLKTTRKCKYLFVSDFILV